MTERTPYDVPWLTRRAHRWRARRTIVASELPSLDHLMRLKRASGTTISVALPALNEASTIGPICRTIREELIERAPLVDELVVVDGGSTDGTVSSVVEAGAITVNAAALMPSIESVPGKGESLWRSLSLLSGDIICWIDADITNFEPHFVSNLVAPLLLDPPCAFVKAFYRRPITHGNTVLPTGGGRVTELLARPLLNALFPELGGMIQPLSGEYAGRRETLLRLPFFTGYSVEVGMLIDLLDVAGLDAIAQVDLGERMHRNRPLEELLPMAYAIARTIMKRAQERGRLSIALDDPSHPLLIPTPDGAFIDEVPELERAPLATLDSPAGDDIVALP